MRRRMPREKLLQTPSTSNRAAGGRRPDVRNQAPRRGQRGEARGAETTGGRGGRNASKAAERAWLGYEWLRGLEADATKQFHCSAEVAGAVKLSMAAHNDILAQSCVFLTLLSFAGSPHDVDWLEQFWTHEVPSLNQTYGLIRKFAKEARLSIHVHTCSRHTTKTRAGVVSSEYRIRKVFLAVGGDRHKSCVILLPDDPTDTGHCLPFIRPDLGKSVPAPNLDMDPEVDPWGETTSDGGEEGERAEDAAPVSSDRAPRAEVAAPTANGRAPAPETPEGRMGESTATQTDGPSEEDETSSIASDPAYEVVDPDETEWVQLDGGGATPTFSYRGVYPGPKGSRWIGGWWPGSCPRETSLPERFVGYISIPRVCSATMDNVARYEDMVLYHPVDASMTQWDVCKGVYTDGHRSIKVVTDGDVVEVRGTSYVAKSTIWHGLPLLKLRVVSRSLLRSTSMVLYGTLATRLGFSRDASVTRMAVPDIPERSRAIAKWTREIHATACPTQVSILNQMKQAAAEVDFDPSLSAEDAGRWVRTAMQDYQPCAGVAGRYAWGYCYSCGKELPGKFKQRLCKLCESGHNSPLARAVAAGERVCSASNPVVYPGVVNTPTRHPGLKAGTATIASSANFWLAPSLLKSCSGPAQSSVEGHDWAALE